MIQHGHTVGGRFSPTYNSWTAMLARCLNPNSEKYPRYGGRGIKVCQRWQEFEAFLADMGERPRDTTIDRINNDGDYEPGNCRWATAEDQANNTRKNKYVTYNGVTHSVSEWERKLGFKTGTIRMRLARGFSVEDAFTRAADDKSKRHNMLVTSLGKTLTLMQWSQETGINYHTIRKRLLEGWSPEKALTPIDHRRTVSR